MDTVFDKKTPAVIQHSIRKSEEYTINGDMVLPEFCPDVATVLKCTVTPCFQNRQWSAEQLLIDGNALIRVLYLDEERRCIRRAEFPQPIAAVVDMGKASEGEMVCLDWTPQYAVCRATGPRRLEVKGAFTIHVRADHATETENKMPPAENGLYLQTKKRPLTGIKGTAERILPIEEVLDAPDNAPPIEMLLDGYCSAFVTEWKMLTDKVIVKGQVKIHQLYTDDSDAGTTAVVDHLLPFSQILDIDGVAEDDACFVNALLLENDIRSTADLAEKNSTVTFRLKLLIQACVFECTVAEIATDAFHCRYPITLETQDIPTVVMTGIEQQSITVNLHPELPPENIEDIIDVWLCPQPFPTVLRENGLHVAARLTVCMLVRDDKGLVGYYERQEEFSHGTGLKGTQADCRIRLTDLRYSVTNKKLEIRAELAVMAVGWEETVLHTVCGVTVDTNRPFQPENAALKLYYADAGERVFDIARHCHASPHQIKAENSLEADILSDPAVLLVPME